MGNLHKRGGAGLARVMVAGVLATAGCGDDLKGAADAGATADAAVDVCEPSTPVATPPASCDEAIALTSGDRIALNMMDTPIASLLCQDPSPPGAHVAWFSVDVPAGQRLAAQSTRPDRVYPWLTDTCQTPTTCIARIPPSDLASNSPGLVWENQGADATMVLEVSSGAIGCAPVEFEVTVGAPPVNATCDGALTLTSGQPVTADSRLSSPAVPEQGCLPTAFPLFYRVTIPAGENLSLEGAGVLSDGCTGAVCPAQGGGYASYRNRTAGPTTLIAARGGFGTGSVTATIGPTAANATCAGATAIDPAQSFEYVPVFGAEDVTTIPCFNGPITDARFYSVTVPAQQSLVVAWAPAGTALLESCAATTCIASAIDAAHPTYRNPTDSPRDIVLRVAHREGQDLEPHAIELALASTAASSCESADPVTNVMTYHQLEPTSVASDLCGATVYARGFLRVDIPAGHSLRAAANYDAGLFMTMVLDDCDASTCAASAVGTQEVFYPGFDVPVDSPRTVTVVLADLKPSTERGAVGLRMELYPAPQQGP